MNHLITNNLAIWTTAPNGIKKLRELILELAVRGLLVPQDPNDESASELLRKITKEKAHLISGGEIKPPKPLPKITDSEKSFDLPQGWKWVRLMDVAEIIMGQSPPGEYYNEAGEGTPLINGPVEFSNSSYGKTIKSKWTTEVTKTCKQNDLIICVRGSTTGRTNIAGFDACIGCGVAAIRPFILSSYTLFFLVSHRERFFKLGTGTTFPSVSQNEIISMVFPLPPLAEQHRIVAKVDELMQLCDQLEQKQNGHQQTHRQLVSTLLATLTEATDAQAFQATWSHIAANFDCLFATEGSIEQLKQTILQLAVMGKLVPQNPNDEPAQLLLEKIFFEKKKLKKNEMESLGDDNLIPTSWANIEVQDFADVRLGSTPSRSQSEYWLGDIPWVSSGEVANKVITDTNEKITKLGYENSSVAIIPKRSLLIAIIGQGKTRGQSALLGIDACTNQNVAALIFNENYVVPEYVWIWARSKYESHRVNGRGGAQPALNGAIVKSFRFYLPPLAEQHRIVAKVDELMTLCEQLKTRLATAQTLQQQLAETLVQQAVV